MRALIPLWTLLTPLALGGAAPLPAQAAADIPITRTATGLFYAITPSGQQFVAKENPAAPVAIVNTWFRVGGRNEHPADEGISHFLEHMLFDGTTVRSKDDYDDIVFRHALTDNASTSYDWTNYFLQGPAENFTTMVTLHAEMLRGPALLDEEFVREREVVKEELRRAQDNPGSWLFRQMITATYPHLNYDHQVLGSMESLDGQSNQQMRDYFHNYYGPNNAITIAVGDFDGETAIRKLIHAFEGWEPKDLPSPPALQRDTQTAPRYVTLDGAFETTSQMLIFKAPGFDSKETYAMDLLMSVLGQGESSRLVRRLRDELGLVASIGAANYSKIDASTLYVSWELLDPAKATEASDAVLAVLAQMRREGPTAEELALAKRQVAIGKVFENENVLGSARSIGAELNALGLAGHEQYLDRTFGVNAQDVQWVAQQFLHPANAVLGIIGPEGTTQPTPTWSHLDAPFTKVIPPADLARLGQNPLTAAAADLAEASAEPEEYTLPNGLTVYLRQSLANPTVGMVLGIKGGNYWETWETAGLGTLTLNSLNEGTATRTKAAIALEQDRLGSAIAFSANRDYYTAAARFLSSDAQAGLVLLADLIQQPTFPEEFVALEKEQQLQAIQAGLDDMNTATFNQLRYAMFGADSAYGRPLPGRASRVAAFTRAEVAQYHARVFAPANAVLSIVGQFDPVQMKAWIADTFGGWEPAPTAETIPSDWIEQPAPVMPEGTQRILNLKDKAQSVIALGIPGPGLRSDDLPAFNVVNTILGSSSQARLFRTLRGKEGLAYSTYSSMITGQGTGALVAYIASRTEKYEQAVTGLRREMTLLATEGPSADEVTNAITYQVGQVTQAHQGHLALALFAATNLARDLPADFQWQQLERVRAVTEDEVRAAAQTYLQLENHWLAISGPLAETAPTLD